MTKWTKRSAASMVRMFGPLEVFAYVNGYWAINGGTHGQATDLASAQAAADAAVEELLSKADADFGLRFGPMVKMRFSEITEGVRIAVASDGVSYSIIKHREPCISSPFEWLCFLECDDGSFAKGSCATEAEAIAAARRHDQERRNASAAD